MIALRRLAFAAVVLPGLALAAPSPDEMLDDPALEQRARALSAELRCVVCQNESIDDSNADLAHDMRRLVRERLVAGDSDAEVLAFLTDRYGDFVLLRPPVRQSTWLLWFGPVLLVLAGAVGLGLAMRGRAGGAVAGPTPLDAEERALVDRLLDDEPRR